MEINRPLLGLLKPLLDNQVLMPLGEKPPENPIIQRISIPDQAVAGDLIFLWSQQGVDLLGEALPSALVINRDLAAGLKFADDVAVFSTTNAELAMALICQDLFTDGRGLTWAQQHPTAVVASGVKVPDSTVLGPGAVIYEGVELGEHCIIGPNVIIEADCCLGDQCILEASVFLGRRTVLGKRVHIKPGAVIGSDGFGFAQDGARYLRLPHLGHVVIEDDVSIGANNCIDRGKLATTRIARGSKLDNLCHVAHNVSIGEDCALTAQFCVAGSTTIGDRVKASGQTAIHPHLKVGDDVSLVFRAGVTESIEAAGAYAGLPLAPLPDYLRYASLLKQLPELKKEIRRLEKRLSQLEA